VDDRPVIQLDIHPTALAAAGVAIQPEWKLDGVNLLPYLIGQKSGAPHDALYWRFGQQIALRLGDWKLVKGVGSQGVEGIERRGKASTDGTELYNLKTDIGEKNNLAEKEPAKFKELVAAWDKWNSELVDPKWFPDRGGAGATKKAGKKKAGAGGAAGGRGAVLQERFKQLDRNGDGKVTSDEFPDADMFKQMDKDGDGIATLEEARAYYSSRRAGGAGPATPQ